MKEWKCTQCKGTFTDSEDDHRMCVVRITNPKVQGNQLARFAIACPHFPHIIDLADIILSSDDCINAYCRSHPEDQQELLALLSRYYSYSVERN